MTGSAVTSMPAGEQDDGLGATIAQDRHYTVKELGELWHMSPHTARRLVENEPGVIKFDSGFKKSPRTRKLIQIRVPARVMQRVHQKLAA